MYDICIFICITADEEPEKKELLGVNTGIVIKPVKPNPFVKIFSFFRKKMHIALSGLQKALHAFVDLLYLHLSTLCDAFLWQTLKAQSKNKLTKSLFLLSILFLHLTPHYSQLTKSIDMLHYEGIYKHCNETIKIIFIIIFNLIS